jgi:hypothetical protein
VASLVAIDFGVLAVECDEPAAKALADRLRNALDTAGTLALAWSAADAEMYAQKRRVAG